MLQQQLAQPVFLWHSSPGSSVPVPTVQAASVVGWQLQQRWQQRCAAEFWHQ
jgi:hypothetical protein